MPSRAEIRLMEVCGTHTMAIARAGLKSLLPAGVELVSGPGCPVCVTPPEVIDAVLELAMRPGVTIATYGDMVRVPGSRRGDSLARRRALGAEVLVVYSPMDAVDWAEAHPQRETVFLGVGFETTAPGTAASILEAKARGVGNFSVFSLLKRVEPALRSLIAGEGFNIQGFLCPGHVATVVGAEGFRFLPRDYALPAVVAGFEPQDIMAAVERLAADVRAGRAELANMYTRAVRSEGNALALAEMRRVFAPARDTWRGLGEIEASGLAVRPAFAEFDAARTFAVEIPPAAAAACRCGDVITGRMPPRGCPLFGAACTPEDPLGPCMVSSEGSCAAAYKYEGV